MDNRRRARLQQHTRSIAVKEFGDLDLVEVRRRTAVIVLVLAVALFSGIFWWSASHQSLRFVKRDHRSIPQNHDFQLETSPVARAVLFDTIVGGESVLVSGPLTKIPESAGLVILLHGCAQSKDSFRLLSRYRTVVDNLQSKNFFTVAVSSQHRDDIGGGFAGSGCWDMRTETDLHRVATVVRALLDAAGSITDASSAAVRVEPRIPSVSLASAGLSLSDVGQSPLLQGGWGQSLAMPVFALGASSGGGFAMLLATRLRLTGVVAYIMNLPAALLSRDASELGPALQLQGKGALRPEWRTAWRDSPAWLAAAESAAAAAGPGASPGSPMGPLRDPRVFPPLLLLPMPRDANIMAHIITGLATLRSQAGMEVSGGDAGPPFGLTADALATETLVGLALDAAAPPLRALSHDAALDVAGGAQYPSMLVPPAAGVSVLPVTPRPLCPWTLHAALPWSVSPAASAALFQLMADKGMLAPSGQVTTNKNSLQGGLTVVSAAIAAFRKTHPFSVSSPPTPDADTADIPSVSRAAYTLQAWPPVGMLQSVRQVHAEADGADTVALTVTLQIDEFAEYTDSCRELIVNSRDTSVVALTELWASALSRAPTPSALPMDGADEERYFPMRLPLPRPTTGQAVLDQVYWGILLSQAADGDYSSAEKATQLDYLAVAPSQTATVFFASPQGDEDATADYADALRVLRKGVSEVLSDIEAIHEMSGQHAHTVASWMALVAVA